MSLVNDMLKDLEAGQREPLPEGVYLDDVPAQGRCVPRLLSGIGLLAVAGVAFYVGVNWQTADRQTPERHSLAQSGNEPAGMALVDSRPIAMPAEAEAAAASQSGEQLAVVTTPADRQLLDSSSLGMAQTEEKLARWLRAAKAALDNDRLTSPIEDNAFTRYQAVLLLEPSHADALAGIRHIAQRYLDFYTKKVRANETAAAKFYLAKAKGVVSNYPELARWLDQRSRDLAENARLAQADRSPTPAEPETTPAPNKSSEPPGGSQTIRSPSKGEVDKRIASRAQELVRQNRYSEAETLLRGHLADNPAAPASGKALFEVYLASGDLVAARQQLDSLKDLAEHEQAHSNARLHMQVGELTAAIEIMEAVQPDLRDASAFHSYLAALYHKAERYRRAADIYERLLGANESQATYWLGLAVSLDALNDRSGALRAFRQARRHGKADAASRTYVEERIQVLSG